jgi:hypothetical protein
VIIEMQELNTVRLWIASAFWLSSFWATEKGGGFWATGVERM